MGGAVSGNLMYGVDGVVVFHFKPKFGKPLFVSLCIIIIADANNSLSAMVLFENRLFLSKAHPLCAFTTTAKQ